MLATRDLSPCWLLGQDITCLDSTFFNMETIPVRSYHLNQATLLNRFSQGLIRCLVQFRYRHDRCHCIAKYNNIGVFPFV